MVLFGMVKDVDGRTVTTLIWYEIRYYKRWYELCGLQYLCVPLCVVEERNVMIVCYRAGYR